MRLRNVLARTAGLLISLVGFIVLYLSLVSHDALGLAAGMLLLALGGTIFSIPTIWDSESH